MDKPGVSAKPFKLIIDKDWFNLSKDFIVLNTEPKQTQDGNWIYQVKYISKEEIIKRYSKFLTKKERKLLKI